MRTKNGQAQLQMLIKSHALPHDFMHTVNTWYAPLAASIAEQHPGTPMVLGVQGSQGSGKSTLAQFLKLLLEHEHGLRCVELSLDDFYLTRAERQALAISEHPLFATRGVPGTHDVTLATNTIKTLLTLGTNQSISIPRFNKAIDDRSPESDWDTISAPVDVVIFEGWCVGVEAQENAELSTPANALEADEDSEGIWRRYVNNALKGEYDVLFSLLDKLVVLQAPSFECVHTWRWLQEQKLAEKYQQSEPENATHLLDEQGVTRFISHYERLTRQCFQCLPAKADWLLTLDADHRITSLHSDNQSTAEPL